MVYILCFNIIFVETAVMTHKHLNPGPKLSPIQCLNEGSALAAVVYFWHLRYSHSYTLWLSPITVKHPLFPCKRQVWHKVRNAKSTTMNKADTKCSQLLPEHSQFKIDPTIILPIRSSSVNSPCLNRKDSYFVYHSKLMWKHGAYQALRYGKMQGYIIACLETSK